MYVANNGVNTVSLIDTTTNTVIDTITVGNGPVGIVYDPDNNLMYVANQEDGTNDGTVSVIDTTTTPPSVIGSPITVGVSPTGIAYDPINQDIFVTNQGGNTVSVIDTDTNTVIDTITVGSQPLGIAYDSINHRMYVANFGIGDDTVSVINLCPRPAELQQSQSTNDIIMTTANENNDRIMIKNMNQQKDITTKDIAINNNNIIEQEEEQKLADQQKIQESNVMSPPSLPKNTIPVGNFD
jgi:YVTN family beta-propeller protein